MFKRTISWIVKKKRKTQFLELAGLSTKYSKPECSVLLQLNSLKGIKHTGGCYCCYSFQKRKPNNRISRKVGGCVTENSRILENCCLWQAHWMTADILSEKTLCVKILSCYILILFPWIQYISKSWMACYLTVSADVANSIYCSGVNDRIVITTDIINFLLKQMLGNEFTELR